MSSSHLLIAGPAEAMVTALVVRYLQIAGIPLYGVASPLPADTPATEVAAGKAPSRPAPTPKFKMSPRRRKGAASNAPTCLGCSGFNRPNTPEALWIALLALGALGLLCLR